MRTPRRILESCKAIINRRCRLVRDVTLRSGIVHREGSRWLVSTTWRGTFTLIGITPGNRISMRRGCIARVIRRVERDDFVLE